MNSVKCLLMGSAAGLMAVSAAQAADLPVKAAPVEYVKVCNIYGAGFWYVPGTDTCMKIGTWVRFQMYYGAGDGGVQNGFSDGGTVSAGRLTRLDVSQATSVYRALVTVDARTQTEFGTLRSYMDVGSKFQGYGTWPTVSSQGLATAGNPMNSQYNNNNVDATRAFIQFAGFTAGRIRSLYDIIAPGAYTLSNQRIISDTADPGMFGIAYTAQFSGGISLSLSLEDPGIVAGQHPRAVTNLAINYWGGGACTVVVAGSCVGGGVVLGGTQSINPGSDNFWDPVVNLRVDQSWGYAAISGALHNDNGGYYNNAIGSTNANFANTNAQGHPGDAYGWAAMTGFLLTDFLGLKGDTLAFETAYGHGAVGYVVKQPGAFFLYGSSGKIAFGNTLDGVYANGTGIDMSDAWSAFLGWEHFWTPKLHTAFQGGVAGISYGNSAKALMCAGAPGFAVTNGSLGFGYAQATGAPAGFINGWSPGSSCNPNFSWWQAGTRTIWNPHPDLDIGVEVLYAAINTANKGATVWQNGASGGLAPGLYTFANEGAWSATFRIQRNFLP
ncbi:MAG: porin [Xanthobacteraceae bacterium]|nr:porin [Xanthobacteraceae bacterium]